MESGLGGPLRLFRGTGDDGRLMADYEMDEWPLCVRCGERSVARNPRTGKLGRVCAVCFMRAVDELLQCVDQEEDNGRAV